MSNALKLDLGEAQIQNAIAVALTESLTPENRDRMIRDVVRAHLNYKSSSYDKETLLSKTAGDLIRGLANEELASRVEEMAPRIRELVREALGPKFEDSVLSSLKEALSNISLSGLRVSADWD